LELPPEPDFLPPSLDASGELAIRAALAFDIPFSLSASYCFSFFTLGRLSGTAPSFVEVRSENPRGAHVRHESLTRFPGTPYRKPLCAAAAADVTIRLVRRRVR
jgi:hypothetical protein